MFAHNRQGKGKANKLYTQNDSPGGSTGKSHDVYPPYLPLLPTTQNCKKKKEQKNTTKADLPCSTNGMPIKYFNICNIVPENTTSVCKITSHCQIR